LLYGEISALCGKEGYCWAGNTYFAGLYETSERSVTNWINALRDRGYIQVSFSYIPGKKEVQRRFLRLTAAGTAKRASGGGEKIFTTSGSSEGPSDDNQGKETAEGAQNALQNGQTGRLDAPQQAAASGGTDNPVGGGEKNFTTYGKKLQEVVKIFSEGGEKNFQDNITNNNIKATTTTDPPASKADPPPDGRTEVAAAALISPQELKTACAAVDRNLVFDKDFYPKAAGFMARSGLGHKYLSWLFEQCRMKNPRSLDGLYYRLFFADNMVEKFKALERLDSPHPPGPPPPLICPVCGAEHDRREDCPSCGLYKNAIPSQITLFRELFKLPREKRDEFLKRHDANVSACGMDYTRYQFLFNNLKKEFGLAESAG
jgi:hypothetical protein